MRAPSLDAAKRTLAAALDVPVWTLRYRIGPASREQVIALYRAELWRRIREGRVSLEELAALHGKTLACHCAPLPCHGEVLARAAAWAASVLAERRAA